MSQVLAGRIPVARLRDLIALGKPRLSALVIFTAAIGVWFAPATMPWGRTVLFVMATTLLVGAANTLNCWIEMELDARMDRTRNRPLPAGRLEPNSALVFGLVVAAISMAVLLAATNHLTTLLGGIALVSYVLVYTPLKRITPWSVVVGAVPGALPPLMGWAAASNSLAPGGWFLFGILFFWQLPHFLAISLYLQDDFRRAGFRVMPLVHGDRVTRAYLFAFTIGLVAVSLLAWPLGIAGPVYTITAGLLGVAFLVIAAGGLRPSADQAWARKAFRFTLLYLPILITVLVLDSF